MATGVDETRGDFPVPPGSFIHIFSEESGKIKTAVGPMKVQIGQNEKVVSFDSKDKIFRSVSTRAAQRCAVVPKGWYAVLKNPAASDKGYPKPGLINENEPSQLLVGNKIIIPGDTCFALWPGQMVEIIQGHTLKTNEYLVVKIYDEEAAKKNWKHAVMNPATDVGTEGVQATTTINPPNLVTGQRIIIKGTDVSFYIPPTGAEVVKHNNNFVREAVTLEMLEYCVLVKENGEKRYIKGPDIVIPEPDEEFYSNEDARKFRAIELSPISGIYIKVIEEYTEADKIHTVGEELFITGNDLPIYFPRKEHAIIAYGNNKVQHAVSIPKGEGRYVLNRLQGDVDLVVGPQMMLADPRTQVIVKRILSRNQVDLWYPGNIEAQQVNEMLDALRETDSMAYVASTTVDSFTKGVSGYSGMSGIKGQTQADLSYGSGLTGSVSSNIASDKFSRSNTFTKPRTVILDTKYEGAVTVQVWTGYAVMVTDSAGNRRVVKGPHTLLLKYDETLEVLALSTGKPKNTDHLIKTVYLKTLANQVSDVVRVETKDFCAVDVKLSYRVNFEGNESRWWNVENYVKLLCDHARSRLKRTAKNYTISEFYNDSHVIIRNTILGESTKDKARTGMVFSENDMRVYDVEVLNVEITDNKISSDIRNYQTEAIKTSIEEKRIDNSLKLTKLQEEAVRTAAAEKAVTAESMKGIQIAKILADHTIKSEDQKHSHEREMTKIQNDLTEATENLKVTTQMLEAQKAKHEVAIGERKDEIAIYISKLEADTKSNIERIRVISEKLGPMIQDAAYKQFLGKLSENFGGISVFDRTSVIDTAEMIFNKIGIPLVQQKETEK